MLLKGITYFFHYIIGITCYGSYITTNSFDLTSSIDSNRILLPKCSKHADTYGQWISTNELIKNENQLLRKKIDSYFYPFHTYNPSYSYSNIWLPNNCSYHRFTNETINQCIDYQLKSFYPFTLKPKLHIYFYGDSALRGIVNGLLRILTGNEIYGPCLNRICGYPDIIPPYDRNLLEHFHVIYSNLIVTFVYIKSLTDIKTIADIKKSMFAKVKFATTYALVLNTGAWDFDGIARLHKNEITTEECKDEKMLRISKMRSSPEINASMWEISAIAESKQIRLIYRTNHHNARFGTKCADRDFIHMILGSIWEIWDNSRISKYSWISQTWDGFHFDRHEVNLPVDHKRQRDYYMKNQYELPGQLEIQLAQSLLQLLFHHCIHNNHNNHSIDHDIVHYHMDDHVLHSNTTSTNSSYSIADYHSYTDTRWYIGVQTTIKEEFGSMPGRWDSKYITDNIYAYQWVIDHWYPNQINYTDLYS